VKEIPYERFLWQMPQTILARIIESRIPVVRREERGEKEILVTPVNLCLCCGEIIFVTEHGYSDHLVRHELGHSGQSEDWGPLYLPVIVLPSVMVYSLCSLLSKFGWGMRRILRLYYRMPWERGANRRSGIHSDLYDRS